MAQTNYTPISLYYSTTASAVPTAANLVPGELAINTNDGKLYYEDSSGVVQVLATKSTGSIGGSNTQVQFNNSGSLGGSSGLTWDGSFLTTSSIKNSALTSGRVTYAGASGLLSDSANLTWDNTNARLGIATTSPIAKLDVGGGITDTVPATYGGTIRVNSSTQTTVQAIGGLEFPVAGDGYGYKMQQISNSGANLAFASRYGSASWTERMRLNPDGNLGIGTSSPTQKLDVNGNVMIPINNSYYLYTTDYGVGTGTGLEIFTGTADTIRFVKGGKTGTESMRIDANGSLLVGTTSTSFSSATRTVLALGSGVNGSLIDFQVSGATSDGYIYYDGTNATIENSNAGYIRFNTSAAERMRIDSSGNLLVGTTSSTGDITNTAVVAGGKFRTVSGSVSAATATATTLFTVPTQIGAYLVTVNVDADAANLYSATYIVNTQGGSSTVATIIYKGSLISVSMSGYAVQGTQTSGGTALIQYSAMRIF